MINYHYMHIKYVLKWCVVHILYLYMIQCSNYIMYYAICNNYICCIMYDIVMLYHYNISNIDHCR